MKQEEATRLVRQINELCAEVGVTALVIGIQSNAKDGNRYTEEDTEPEIVFISQIGDEDGTEKIRRLLAAMGPENSSTLVMR